MDLKSFSLFLGIFTLVISVGAYIYGYIVYKVGKNDDGREIVANYVGMFGILCGIGIIILSFFVR